MNIRRKYCDDYDPTLSEGKYIYNYYKINISQKEFDRLVDSLPLRLDIFLDNEHTLYDYYWNERNIIDNDDLVNAITNYAQSKVQRVHDNTIDDDFVEEMIDRHLSTFIEYFGDLFYDDAQEEYYQIHDFNDSLDRGNLERLYSLIKGANDSNADITHTKEGFTYKFYDLSDGVESTSIFRYKNGRYGYQEIARGAGAWGEPDARTEWADSWNAYVNLLCKYRVYEYICNISESEFRDCLLGHGIGDSRRRTRH